MEAISENAIGEDDREGNVAPIVYNIDNARYEATYRDVAEVDKNISFDPLHPRLHLGEIAVYEAVYNSLAHGGNCFGMCLEAVYAREHRSLFNEPVFSSNSYRNDGQKLIPNGVNPADLPNDTEVADQINVKQGYQCTSE
jgi:hypothetical protein